MPGLLGGARCGELVLCGVSSVLADAGMILEAGVAGDMPDRGSAELGARNGDGGSRFEPGSAPGCSIALERALFDSSTRPADLGGSLIVGSGTTGGSKDGGWVLGAGIPLGSLTVVSIISCLAF